jgi:hypothetical protein
MKLKKRKNLILALIKDDLINLKLIYSLNSFGLAADGYMLYTSTTIINLMKIKATGLQWEQIHEGYLELTRKVMQIDIQESPRLLDALAEEIEEYLSKCKIE